MSDSNARTGTFPQMRPSAGDTACSVKGVLGIHKPSFIRRSPARVISCSLKTTKGGLGVFLGLWHLHNIVKL